MISKQKIIIISVIVVAMGLVAGYIIFFQKPPSKLTEELTKEEAAAQQEAQRIKTVTGMADEKEFKPLVENEAITGVATGAVTQTAPVSPPPPLNQPVGAAPSDIQAEIEAIRKKR